jgi:hypothetical protein
MEKQEADDRNFYEVEGEFAAAIRSCDERKLGARIAQQG